VDFIEENPQLIEQFVHDYREEFIDDLKVMDKKNEKARYAKSLLEYGRIRYIYNQQQLLENAKNRNEWWAPGEEKECIYGDEQDDLLGEVFDYILREGGNSTNFRWNFKESLR
jgi:hypothetical protein